MIFSKNNNDKSLEEFVRDLENDLDKTFRNEISKLKRSVSTEDDKLLYDEFTYNSSFFESWVNASSYTHFIKKVPAPLRHQAELFLVLNIMISHLFNEQDRSKISDVLSVILNDIDAPQDYANMPKALLNYFNYIQDYTGLDFSRNFILECIDQISIILTN